MRWFIFLTILLSTPMISADEPPVMRLEPNTDILPMVKPVQERLYRVVQNEARHLLTLVRPWEKDSDLKLVTKSNGGEHGIRPNAGMIEGLAFLYRFGPYDEKIVGISRADLLEKVIIPMMRYCTSTHKTGKLKTSDGRQWGDAWQSALWSQRLGNAAWYLWDDLPDDLRKDVRRLVAREADRIAAAKPPHRLQYDTKAEENAWNSQILSIAVILMPDDPRRQVWERAFQKWVLSAHLRPADKNSKKIVDGRTIAEQFTGANVFDDYTVENHGFVHPDYMTAYSLTLCNALHYDLTGRAKPEAFLHNLPGIYTNLKWFTLPDGGFVYPNGQDWELFRNPIWCYKHLLMAVHGSDPDSWKLALNSLDTLEKMQRRHPSGMIYGETEAFFPSSRTDIFCYLTRAWLELNQARTIPDDLKLPIGVRRLDSAKIVLHRSPKTLNSFSWGKKVMAMSVPMRLDRIVSPHQRSGVGHIRAEGHNKGNPLPIRLEKFDVETTADSFTAQASIDHGENLIRAELYIRSDPQGVLTIREKLVALTDVTTTEVATGLVGILNNPEWVYEQGRRRIAFDGKESVIPALSRKRIDLDATRQITIDSALKIQGEKPFYPHYVGAKKVKRGRATDDLYLNYVPEKKKWRAGETISEYNVQIYSTAE